MINIYNKCKNNLISVVMPVYNSEKYLTEAIESILCQTYTNLELIIIEDYSDDDSLKIAKSYQVRDGRVKVVANQQNRKQAYCRNLGIELSAGDYIAFLDSDDLAHKTRIEKQLEYLENNLDCIGCGSYGEYIDKDGNLSGQYITPPIIYNQIKAEAFLGDNPFIQSSMMLRKNVLDKYNLRYNESYGGIAEDFQFWLQILRYGLELRNIAESLVYYRCGDEQQATTQNRHRFKPVVERLVVENIRLICRRKWVGKLYQQSLLRDSFIRKLIAVILYPVAAILINYYNIKSKVLDECALKKALSVHAPRVNLTSFIWR